ncbi:MAG: sulfite exporter TauE/SafE family protein [Gammaproteobacteria bacterium]|nr:MAG: sulfite exporter TauE/SafE family protein [Gammaproteobacteria bacterium]
MDQLSESLLLFLIALLANGLSALAGGGAGLLQLPVLLFLGLGFATALATHKIASVALGVGASLRHVKEGRLKGALVLWMLAGGVPGVLLGANLVLAVPEEWLRRALGVLTLGLGVYSMVSPELGQQVKARPDTLMHRVLGALGLFCIGVLNGSLTSGTGLFVTLWLVLWFGLDYSLAVAHTLVIVGIVWNGAGALAVAMQAPVKWIWLPALIAGALAGGYAGAHLSIVKGNRLVKRAFEVLTILVGLALLYRG